MEGLTSLAGVCLAIGCAIGGVANAVDDWKYQSALKDPNFYNLIDESGNSVSEQFEFLQ